MIRANNIDFTEAVDKLCSHFYHAEDFYIKKNCTCTFCFVFYFVGKSPHLVSFAVKAK